jgi:SAM-dependent methyltransferase
MKSLIRSLALNNPTMFLLINLCFTRMKAVDGDLQSVHNLFVKKNSTGTTAVDLGCGSSPKNMFNAANILGVDLYEDLNKRIKKVRLGFEPLPFADESIDYLTAYDVLEHIPRYADILASGNNPFIYLMNECYRVLKKGGIFLSSTPIYPYLDAFQDPTHNNIITKDTFRLYFSKQKYEIAKHYGVTADFHVEYQRMMGPLLIAVLRK